MQMLALEPAWRARRHVWVTYSAADVDHLLADEDRVLVHGPTNRSIANLLRNLLMAWRTVRELDPDVILSTGAGVALPFFLVGRLTGRRLVYVESLTRLGSLSLTGRLVYPLADDFFVQWPSAATRERTRYEGAVL